MLKLKGISKNFGDKRAVDGAELEVKKGKIVGLLGPNGAGKTTLLRMITGFLTANEGEIEWEGDLADVRSIEYRKKIGYLPENNPLYPAMLVREYLEFIASLKEANNIDEVIRECGLDDVTNQKIETLSKGYKQRVGLAAALLGEPELLILDEPTSGLDPNQIIEVRSLIKKLAKNKAVLFSTHILPEAESICDRLVIISRGKVVLNEETKKVKHLEKKFMELTA